MTPRAAVSAPSLSAGAAALIACLLLPVLPFVAGCTSADEEAREHLAAATTHLEAYRAADSRIATELARAERLPESEATTTGAEVVAIVRIELKGQRADVEAARTELVAVTESGASAALVDYAALQVAVTDTLLELDGAMVAYVAALEPLYEPVSGEPRSREEADALVATVQAARDALAPLRDEYDERSAAVLRHYEDHELGVEM